MGNEILGWPKALICRPLTVGSLLTNTPVRLGRRLPVWAPGISTKGAQATPTVSVFSTGRHPSNVSPHRVIMMVHVRKTSIPLLWFPQVQTMGESAWLAALRTILVYAFLRALPRFSSLGKRALVFLELNLYNENHTGSTAVA